MRVIQLIIAACATLTWVPSTAQTDEPRLVAVDENLWVLFYDVPSHRFRAIRDSFVKREFDAAAGDLVTSAGYLTIESGRAFPEVAERLEDVASQMTWISQNISDNSVTTSTLDRLFGRAHWLLAQHYLYLAREERDALNNRLAGRYLWATTHHLERAVLWSNARINRDIVRALDDLRDLAIRLQDPQKSSAARKERPIVRAEKVLIRLGAEIDRPVVLKSQ